MEKIVTIDLPLQGRRHMIAAYLVPHSSGVVLVESGPGSTLSDLESGLEAADGLFRYWNKVRMAA